MKYHTDQTFMWLGFGHRGTLTEFASGVGALLVGLLSLRWSYFAYRDVRAIARA